MSHKEKGNIDKLQIQKKQPTLLFVTNMEFSINNTINLYYFSVVHLGT